MKRKPTRRVRNSIRYLRRQRHTLYKHVSRLPLRKPVGLWRFSRRAQVAIVVLVVLGASVPPTLLRPHSASALSMGPNGPTAAVSAAGANTPWTGTANVLADDSASTSANNIPAAGFSNTLNVTNFGFNIPTGATINGVQVDIERDETQSLSKAQIRDNSITLLKGGVSSGTNLADTVTTWPYPTDAYATYGGTANLWGNSLAPSDVNDINFGVAISVKNVKSGSGATNGANINYVRVTITYSPPPISFNQASYRLFNNQDATGSAQSPTFAAHNDTSVGSAPQSITTFDYNSDGYQDIAVVNESSGTVSVLDNYNGTGFLLISSPAVGSFPIGITAADFNGDGKPDLAVTNSGSNTVSILTGDGMAGFTLASSPAVGSNPGGIIAADFNGDGKADLAVANYADSTVSILTGNGSGGFTTSSTVTVGTNPDSFAAADFNGDGKPDLAVSDRGAATLSILLNNGSGGFSVSSSPAVGSTPRGVTTADFNGDGKADLAVANSGDVTLSVLIGNGSGGFTLASSPTVGTFPYASAAADFDGDGKVDLAAVNQANNTISILKGNGSGGFTSSSTSTVGTSPVSIVTSDFNNDGKPDLATANNSTNNISTLLNTTAPPMDVGTPLTLDQNIPATTPGDGQPFRMRMDIGVSNADVAAGGQSFELQYAPMTTSCDTTFTNTPASAYVNVTDTSTVRYYDNPAASNGAPLTGNTNDPTDGTNIVALQTYQEKGTTTFNNSKAITTGQDGMWDFALTTASTSGGQHYCLRIVTSTGTQLNSYSVIPEIIIPPAHLTQAAYRFFNNQDATNVTSASFPSHTDFSVGASDSPQTIGYADINTDGKQDMITGTSTIGGGDVGVFLNTTATNASVPTFSSVQLLLASNQPTCIISADFNGDGKPDIATGDNNTTDNNVSDVSIFPNTTASGASTASFGTKVTLSVGSNIRGIAVTDFNGDGKPDIVFTNSANTTVSVLLNTTTTIGGSPTFSTTNFSTVTGPGPFGVTTADINDDGKPDIIATAAFSTTGNAVAVLLNTTAANASTPSFTTAVTFITGNGPVSVTTADINDDGKPDIATANATDSTVSTLLNTTPTNASTPSFATHADVIVGTKPQGITAGDFDGDGKPDLATSNATDNTVSVLHDLTATNGSAPTFSVTSFTTGTAPTPVTATDFNGDGKLDLATANPTPQTVSVLLNTSASSQVLDVGTPLATQDTAATLSSDGIPFRMRLDVGVSLSNLAASGQTFKLQYALRNVSCDTSFTNTTNAAYSDVTTTSAVRYFDNTIATNGTAFYPNGNDPTDGSNSLIRQTYQESTAASFSNTNATNGGQDGMWDFALTTSGTSAGQHYCLRVVTGTGSALNAYAVIPEIIMPGSANAAPNMPTSLAQKKTDDTVLATGAWVNATTVKFTASATDPDSSDTLQLCVEKKAIGSAFTGTEDLCGTGVAYSGTAVTPTVTISGISDATEYHWQARIKDSGGLYSSWVSYDTNAETARDFGVDTTAPTGGTVYDGTAAGTDASFNDGSLSSLSANWSGIDANASGLAQYEYSIGTSAGATDVKGWTSTGTTASTTASSLTLHTSNKYFVNVRTTDNAGNTSVISSDGQFVAPSVSFSVSPSVVTFNNLKASNSYTDTETTTLTTSTNAYGGYVVRNLMTDLLRSKNNKTIPDFNGGTYAAPDSWQSGDIGFGYTSSDANVQGVNKFQSATCPGGSSLATPGCYAPFSHTGPGDIVADDTNSVSGSPISNEQFIITYRVTTPSTQPATTYNASAIYSITPIY